MATVLDKVKWRLEQYLGRREDGLRTYLKSGWVVIYSDTVKSNPMPKGTAFDYAVMFNAPRVVRTKLFCDEVDDVPEVRVVRTVHNPYYETPKEA